MRVESGGVVRAVYELSLGATEAPAGQPPRFLSGAWYAVADEDCGELVVCSLARMPPGSVVLAFRTKYDALTACDEHRTAYDTLAADVGAPPARPGRFGVVRLWVAESDDSEINSSEVES